MNERIKQLRKYLNLTLEEFGGRIGITKSSMSLIENGKNGMRDQTIKSICREFGVSEEWLRTGDGDMLRQDSQSIIDRMADEYSFTNQERAVLSAYLNLDSQDRAAIMRYVDNLVAQLAAPAPVPDTGAAAIATMQDYAAMVSEEKGQADESSTTVG